MKVGYQVLVDLQQQQAFNSGDFLLLCHLNHSYIINTTQFLLLQAHLQTYLLQYLMKLMVLFMHQLQLIGIKTNLESFVTTTLMEHMLNRHQLHLFLWVSKQWGYCSSRTATFPIPFPASALFIVAVPKTTSTSATATGAEYLGTTSVNLYLHELRVGISQAAIEQWGYGNSESTQTFPIKFTNSVIGIYGSKRAINYEYTFAATSITNTNFFMSTRNSEGSSRVIACNWLAIGQQQTK